MMEDEKPNLLLLDENFRQGLQQSHAQIMAAQALFERHKKPKSLPMGSVALRSLSKMLDVCIENLDNLFEKQGLLSIETIKEKLDEYRSGGIDPSKTFTPTEKRLFEMQCEFRMGFLLKWNEVDPNLEQKHWRAAKENLGKVIQHLVKASTFSP